MDNSYNISTDQQITYIKERKQNYELHKDILDPPSPISPNKFLNKLQRRIQKFNSNDSLEFLDNGNNNLN